MPRTGYGRSKLEAERILSRCGEKYGFAWAVPRFSPIWTTDLSTVLQEVVDRPGWSAGNAVAFIITGTGTRTAESVEGSIAGAPLLHVEFADSAPNDTTDPSGQVTSPADGAVLAPGTFDVVGVSSDDLSGVARVQVRVQQLGTNPAFSSAASTVSKG